MSAKSAFVSTAGVFLQLIEGIMAEVKEGGGNEEDVYEAAKSPATLKRIAILIVEAGVAKQTFKIVVDYSQTLQQMIAVGNYDFVHQEITADHFFVQMGVPRAIEVVLFHFNRLISSDDAIAAMAKEGCRPATIEELLFLKVSQPGLKRKLTVALGSRWRHPCGDLEVPILHWRVMPPSLNPRLQLYCLKHAWHPDTRFVAVRK